MSYNRMMITTLGLALLLAIPAFAQVAIAPGFDYWQTVGSGATRYSFADDPLPAGFFCRGSKAFVGEITFEGVPLTTDPPRALGTTDTIVERLDDAKFDDKGLATTRIKVRALLLEGREKVQNACGEFAVTASLVGEQPTTQMALQTSDLCNEVGVFTTTLDLNVALAFTETSTGQTLSVTRQVSLPTFSDEPFVIGTTATACPVGTLSAAQSVQVLNGADAQFGVFGSNQVFVAGCWCNCDGTICLPILPEHTGENEEHFTMTTCEFFGGSFCDDDDVIAAIRGQVEELYEAGVILESPEIATDKLVNKQY